MGDERQTAPGSSRARIARALGRVPAPWWLVAGMAAVVAGLWAGPIAGSPPLETPALPWWALAVAVAVTERWPVHLEFRRSAHSFSLTDMPITLALVFAGGSAALAGVVAGAAAAMLLRRLPPVKVAFNVAQFALATALGVLVVRAVADAELGPATWAGVFVATQLGGLVTIAMISAVIWLSEGRPTAEQVRQMFGMDAVVTLTNTSLALVLAVIVVERPDATPLLLLPVLVVFASYRVYVAQRMRHEKLEFLYEANRTLSQSPEVALALEGLLGRALEAFHAEQAEVVLFGGDGATALSTSLGPGERRRTMEPVDDMGTAVALRDLAAAVRGPLVLDGGLPAPLRAALDAREISGAMVAPLEGGERVIGVLLLANRIGATRGFSDDDLALFGTLAANASAALQYDRLEQAVSDLRSLQEQLHHQAYHDPLTGLANRSLFHQEVRGAVASAGGAAVMFIDLDDFKTVNDTLGHAVGDELLRAVADRLGACVRAGDVVARLGGDEFAVLVRESEDVERAAVALAQRALAAFEEAVELGGRLLQVRLSIGIATKATSGADVEDLLRDADVAMYHAKAGGKGRAQLFDPAMRASLLRRHGLQQDLEAAIRDGRLGVHFQPIVDIATGQVVAAEALVRWTHPSRGRVPPYEFIRLAEETGLIVPLGRHVLRNACLQAAAWSSAGPDGTPLTVNVNLSARELEDEDLVEAVREAVLAAGIAPGQLVLEITETLLVRDAERGAGTLSALRSLGVRLALDDFGTGWSSLSYLRTLPLDVLKIAKPFIDGMSGDEQDLAFVRLITELARTVGLQVVAEGVERPEQLAALRDLGCHQAQGYLFAEPLPAGDAWWSVATGGRALPVAAEAAYA